MIRLPKEFAVGVLEYLWALIVVLNGNSERRDEKMTLTKRPMTLRIPTASQGFLSLIEYGWAIIIVLNGNSVYNANALKEYHLLELCVIATLVLLLVELWRRQLHITRTQGITAVFLMVYHVLYVSVRSTKIANLDFICLFVAGLPLLFLLFSVMHRNGLLIALMLKLFNVVFALALLSLYYWIFGVMLQIIQPNMYTAVRWGTMGYIRGFNGLHFMTQLENTFFKDQFIFRNTGIFTEAPMFNLWLNMALGAELFLKERPSRGRVLIYTITIVTTMSVTGLIFLVICFVLHIIRNYHRMNRTQRNLFFFSAMFLIPTVGGLMIYSMMIKSDTQSYLMRLSDYVAGVKLWLDYPIFGSGYADLRSLQQYSYAPNGVLGFSNSVSAVLGTGGLWIALLFYLPHIGILFSRLSKSKSVSMFGLCYLFLFCTTAFFGRFIAVLKSHSISPSCNIRRHQAMRRDTMAKMEERMAK